MRLWLVFAMWVFGQQCTLNAQCGGTERQIELKSQLIKTATNVVRAIEGRDVDRFMDFVSERGIGFGVDVPPLRKADLQRQLQSRSGYYCLLFSTPCMEPAKHIWQGDPVLSKFRISYRDWLKQTRYKTDAELLTGSDMCGGLVRFTEPGSEAAPRAIELEFTLRRGRWLLVNTPYQLGE
jgi:hypothetical protein